MQGSKWSFFFFNYLPILLPEVERISAPTPVQYTVNISAEEKKSHVSQSVAALLFCAWLYEVV